MISRAAVDEALGTTRTQGAPGEARQDIAGDPVGHCGPQRGVEAAASIGERTNVWAPERGVIGPLRGATPLALEGYGQEW
jgi:hypothetical protein